MAPGIDGLPAAEREVDVSGPVAEFLRSVPPPMLLQLRLGLRAFEWMPFPRRFSRLDQARPRTAPGAARRLALALKHDLLLMAKLFSTLGYAVTPEVQARVGYEIGCGLADGGVPEPARGLGDTDPRPEGEECDVVIVGSGAGGAVAAATLAEAGLDVLVLEAGPHYDRDSYPRDQLEAIQGLYRGSGLTVAAGRPPVVVPVAKVVGGTTVVNSGTCFRAPEAVLDDWARALRDRLGAATSTPTSPRPRRRSACSRSTPSGWDATASWRWRARRRSAPAAARSPATPASCVQCSSCPFGCPLDAKRGMHVSYLPRAVAAGRPGPRRGRGAPGPGRGRPRGRRRVPGRRAASGAPAGQFTVRARRAVIVAGGALGTPELLRRSGLGNGAVGRNLHVHPACWVGARYEEEVRGWEGVMQSYYVDKWESRGILLEATFTPLAFGGAWLAGSGADHQRAMLDFAHIASIGVQLTDRSERPRPLGAGGSLRISYDLTRDDAARVTFGIARAAEVHFAAGATEVYPNVARVKVLRPGDLADLRGDPLQARRTAPRGLPPDGHRPHRRRSRARRLRPRRLPPRHRRPLRRRRLALPDRPRRQPDDDDHRLRQADRPRGRERVRRTSAVEHDAHLTRRSEERPPQSARR